MSKNYLLLLVMLFLVGSSACGSGGIGDSPGRPSQQEVDQRFREFYGYLGGLDVIGLVISPKFPHGENEYQYTATALMVYVPDAPDGQKFQLVPLGIELGIAEPPLNPDEPGGHAIYEGFVGLYTRLGARIVGLPITEVRYNLEKGRIEQHFENLGFYQMISDPEGEVHLLSYGAWKCAVEICGYVPPDDSAVDLPTSSPSPFEDTISRLDLNFTGLPLTPPYTAFDGMLEQIFEHVVIIADPKNPGGIRLRPIVGMLGNSPLREGDFAIPGHFLEYLNRHSGLEYSGKAVTEYQAISDDAFRQCFTNLCLDYFPNAPEDLRVRPVPLGYTYKNLFYRAENENDKFGLGITIQVWEAYPTLDPDQVQEIGVRVWSGDTPIPNAQPVLVVTIPGLGDVPYHFPATREDGQSYLQLDPIEAPNGTRIEYRACLGNLNSERFCVLDDFLIWGD